MLSTFFFFFLFLSLFFPFVGFLRTSRYSSSKQQSLRGPWFQGFIPLHALLGFLRIAHRVQHSRSSLAIIETFARSRCRALSAMEDNNLFLLGIEPLLLLLRRRTKILPGTYYNIKLVGPPGRRYCLMITSAAVVLLHLCPGFFATIRAVSFSQYPCFDVCNIIA